VIFLNRISKFKKAKIPIVVYFIVAILIVLAGLLNIIFNEPSEFAKNKDIAIQNCIDKCLIEQGKGTILKEGPCLSEEIAVGWVCDVAHDPRLDIVDNNPKNQCESYENKSVKHFVEITENCDLIRVK